MTACSIDYVGRADYFGNLPNLAARVMALAAPGQVLLEGFQGFGPELLHKDELSALLPQQPSMVQGDHDYEAVEVVQLGKYPIKASVHYLALLFCSRLHGRYLMGKTVQQSLCTSILCCNTGGAASAQGAAKKFFQSKDVLLDPQLCSVACSNLVFLNTDAQHSTSSQNLSKTGVHTLLLTPVGIPFTC